MIPGLFDKKGCLVKGPIRWSRAGKGTCDRLLEVSKFSPDVKVYIIVDLNF